MIVEYREVFVPDHKSEKERLQKGLSKDLGSCTLIISISGRSVDGGRCDPLADEL